MRVLVTGGAGFIGSHLVHAMLEDGHEVRVLDNFATGRRENLLGLYGEIELIEGDIQSYERVHNSVVNCEVVMHQAAMPSVPRSIQDPLTSNASNVVGTLNVLLAARDAGVRLVVFASSSSIYGASKLLPKSESHLPLPISPYAVAKLASEGYCRSFHAVYGLQTVALRYFNVFGPHQDPLSQYAAVIPKFLTAVMAGRRPTIFGDGTQTRDFTYVSDVVRANRLAMCAPNVAGNVVNIACGGRVSLNEVVSTIGDICGKNIRPKYADPRAGDVLHSMADITLARELLGFEPSVAFRDGVLRTMDAFRPATATAARGRSA